MLALLSNPPYQTLTIRPVNKATDRTAIHRIFRQEFYGDDPRPCPEEEIWKIYDTLESRGIYGAYLVCRDDHPLFLLEVHPPLQLDIAGELTLQNTDLGVYCFFSSLREASNSTALKACLDSLLSYPGIRRIITTVGYASPDEPKVALLKKAGFVLRPESTVRLAILECTRTSLPGASSSPN